MLNKTWTVYSLINDVTGERYIGMTSQSLKKRFRNGRGYKGYTKIKQAIDIYGWDNFSYEILAKTESVEKAEELEKYYIAKYDTINLPKISSSRAERTLFHDHDKENCIICNLPLNTYRSILRRRRSCGTLISHLSPAGSMVCWAEMAPVKPPCSTV